jgi:hypothetical protein
MVIGQHEFCVQPDDPNTVVWRYWDLPKFLNLISARQLWFSRADLLGDQFEGSFSAATIEHRKKKAEREAEELGIEVEIIQQALDRLGSNADWLRYFTFISCWTRKEHEVMGLWQSYVRGSGVATKTTFKALTDAMRTDERMHVTEVQYIDFAKEAMPDFNWLSPYVYKRIQYSEESELRAIIPGRIPPEGGPVDELVAQSPPGIPVPVDLDVLLQEIRVYPGAPSWFHATIAAVAERFRLSCPVTASEVDGIPFY